jgi:NAD(P)-dependent dehydrogenase (short-subunit alcohol dehydrogenase family)
MAAQGGGSIINIATFAAFEPEAAFPTSAVARAGLASFTELVADALAPKGVRITTILPGFIDSFPEKAEIIARIPMKRYGTVGEIAGVISFLASAASAYITGQNLRVDGGITRSVWGRPGGRDAGGLAPPAPPAGYLSRNEWSRAE